MAPLSRVSLEYESVEMDELDEWSDDARAGRGERARSVRRAVDRIVPFECRQYFRKKESLGFSLLVVFIVSFSWLSSDKATPPLARREEDRVIYAGVPPPGWDSKIPRQSSDSEHPLMDPPIAVEDPYGWMRDETRSDKEVLKHLKENNKYTETRTRHLKKLTKTLYNEMKSFMMETSHSFPSLEGDYYYYRRTVRGKPYPLHARAPKPSPSENSQDDGEFQGEYLKKHLSLWDGSQSMPVLPNEAIYLDENVLARGSEYFNVGSINISPSQDLMAFTVDRHGNEFYELIIQRIGSGETIPIMESGSPLIITGQVQWGADDKTLFYTKPDDAQRSYQVFRRTFDKEMQSDEELIFEELEPLFFVGISKTSDKKYLIISNDSSESSEVSYIDLSTKLIASPSVITDRVQGVLYFVEHYMGTWVIVSNVGGSTDFQLWKAKVDSNSEWERIVDPHGAPLLDGVPIEGLVTFKYHWVVKGRQDGLMRLWAIRIDDDANVILSHQLKWDADPAHSVDLGYNDNFEASWALVEYESPTTPLEYELVDLREPANSHKRIVVMKTPIPGYHKDDYACDRIYVTSRDGKTQIPVSLVYLKSTMDKAKSRDSVVVPIHLYAYGAYGVNIEDTFSLSRLTLLNRGMIYAIAHVRGGGEMGREWYESGKFLTKKNTFNDFIDVGRHFVEDKKWTTPDLLSCEGRSAGGLTIGAVLNQAPDLFRVAILGVPFVDLVATMTDASIPLTSGEWDEWGNPNEDYFFQYMMEYSPMNNVQSGVEYPSCLIKAGLFDPRVAYWEPLKFTATLRDRVANDKDRPICLQTDMAAGHFSASDRYKHIQSTAFDYSFLLWQLGIE